MSFSTTSKLPRGSRRTASTRERLLKAAAEVFAREGLAGGTTREIARLAEVNEVTLFRHFQTKEGLIAAVASQTLEQVPSGSQKLENKGTAAVEADFPGGDLHGVLLRFANLYHSLLSEHLPLIRTFIGEIHRHEEQAAQVLHGIFRPRRQELIAKLQQGQAEGWVRKDANVTIAADQLGSMIFGHVIRRTSRLSPDYQTEEYLAACVEMVARGIGVEKWLSSKSATQQRRKRTEHHEPTTPPGGKER